MEKESQLTDTVDDPQPTVDDPQSTVNDPQHMDDDPQHMEVDSEPEFTLADIDRMLASDELKLGVPSSRRKYPSEMWSKGLMMVMYPDNRIVPRWYRCRWCGHSWNCDLKGGTNNMLRHVSGHLNASMTVTIKEQAKTIHKAMKYALEYGAVAEEDLLNMMPVKKRNERTLKW